RKISREQVLSIADGRVFSGRKAKEYGLVDHLGDMKLAAGLASRLAGKDGNNYDLVYPRKKRTSVFDYLMESAANQLTRSLKEKIENWGGVGYLYYPSL
ncbi:MAG TPA: S49 family peptidase, partial [Smithellaceae bacterium]|nr:S49 family peptidase [Smithellaceae bacterium]